MQSPTLRGSRRRPAPRHPPPHRSDNYDPDVVRKRTPVRHQSQRYQMEPNSTEAGVLAKTTCRWDRCVIEEGLQETRALQCIIRTSHFTGAKTQLQACRCSGAFHELCAQIREAM